MPRVRSQLPADRELKQRISCTLTPSSHENLKQLAAHLQFDSFSAFIEALGTHQFILSRAAEVDVEEQVLTLLSSANTEERIRTLK
ncbi:MAG TPA: hypothetical protein V6C91_09650, partial [Coleofasciculaceae cyanobacterium]